MKVKIRFKTPDAVESAIKIAVDDQLIKERPHLAEIPRSVWDDETNDLAEFVETHLTEECYKWCPYGEFVTIVVDTDTGTATVEQK